jgi:hypothetical protein
MASASRALHLSRALQGGRRITTLLRPLAATESLLPAGAGASAPGAGLRCFATQPATSSLRDSSPNWINTRPSKEMILLDGCDFEHWLVVMEPPPGDPSNPDIPRDEIIDSYIKTLAQVVGRYIWLDPFLCLVVVGVFPARILVGVFLLGLIKVFCCCA